ncbi:HD domain-containing protein [Orenia marismortui]|uniref:HD domain-containing protein n=1 Tax=Orenia marismortui TaxID=46469 RepID=UPI000376E8A2|nr:HD domain-containing protein [Orenia marismortui]
MFKNEIILKMKNYFAKDQKRIDHALNVTNYAEKLIKHCDKEINEEIIIYAAILHDIGIHEAERKYNSTAGKYQELEGPPIAKKILNDFPITQKSISEICEIIAHHHSPGVINTMNFKILYDADWLVNLPEEYNYKENKDKLDQIIDKLYLTKYGNSLARKLFLG